MFPSLGRNLFLRWAFNINEETDKEEKTEE